MRFRWGGVQVCRRRCGSVGRYRIACVDLRIGASAAAFHLLFSPRLDCSYPLCGDSDPAPRDQTGRSVSHWHYRGDCSSVPILAYGLSLSLPTQNILLTRWLSLTAFQIHDAGDFLRSSVNLLLTGGFETVRGRPIAKLLFAGLLELLHFNVQGVLWVTTAMAAAVAFAAVVGRLMGCAAGVLAGYILFDFSHDHIGGLTSEIPGFIFGTIGIALLLHAAASGTRTSFAAGFAILCIAMVTRFGAVFVRPALLCWSYWYHPPLLGRRWGMAVAGLLLGAMVVLSNQWIARTVILNFGGSFSNTADLWYGTIVKGQALLGTRNEAELIAVTRWLQIYADHPELSSMTHAAQTSAKFKVLIQTATRYPLEAAVGGLREIWAYVFDIKSFRFIEYKPLRIVITLIAYVSVWLCFVAMRRKQTQLRPFYFIPLWLLSCRNHFCWRRKPRGRADDCSSSGTGRLWRSHPTQFSALHAGGTAASWLEQFGRPYPAAT